MAKAFISTVEKTNYAINVSVLTNNDYPNRSFGQQIDDIQKLRAWLKDAKSIHIGCKGKPTMTSVKAWIKENKPTEFYAKWTKDSSTWKDDCVEIFVK